MVLRIVSVLLVLGALAGRAPATWSIILINTRTGDIAIGSATCITRSDLAVFVPVVVVGKGGGCAQSSIDSTGMNRIFIRDQLLLGTDPMQIIQQLALRDPGHQTRQYGIVDLSGRATGFTGTSTGSWAGDRTGRMGDIVYALQGNVLTGAPVLAAAELAIWSTPGDVADKLMAAMQEARRFGGDGRCSCSSGGPTACGSPPSSFTKSSHIAFMLVARLGDADGVCNGTVGCANGSYYMRLNVAGQTVTSPDPVAQLQTLFGAWKQAQVGRPDHHNSVVTFAHKNLPNNGLSQTVATIELRDRFDNRILQGGATVTAQVDPTSAGNVTFGPARDNGDGTYSLPVIAGRASGKARLMIAVDDGQGPRTLSPFPEIDIVTDRLWADRSELSATTGGSVEFAINPGPALGANHAWVLLASNSGTIPGIWVPPLVIIPLNPDPLFYATIQAAFGFVMPELIGILPPTGTTVTTVTFPPGAYGLPLGVDVSFAAILWNPLDLATNPVNVRLVR